MVSIQFFAMLPHRVAGRAFGLLDSSLQILLNLESIDEFDFGSEYVRYDFQYFSKYSATHQIFLPCSSRSSYRIEIEREGQFFSKLIRIWYFKNTKML